MSTSKLKGDAESHRHTPGLNASSMLRTSQASHIVTGSGWVNLQELADVALTCLLSVVKALQTAHVQ